ncbi:beta-ketoacyl-[acyl-carrier-protein] synthase family protein [Sutcliffiella rhizosphaerae]|uniref:3-oxoacyl-[acyl-carrier-protein] synthase 2 n=1 Tax=Sutcliffiella rhizosphaerae TaxID=2880967 RepID=A0ABM8YTW2_9BACI|nr:beta-ketoacyl-[acyl-carrier-protein] synthase family protein [Sutcliffiella rhizosphaerae]CAG9623397.1 3-oxoacyl-[acyl-carrier-protein] synthase 2 [Sutcliffiella rhizosphaerae]
MNICVSGTAVICSIGNNIESTWNNLIKGHSGIEKITQKFPNNIKDFHAYTIKDDSAFRVKSRNFGSATGLFYNTVAQALEDAELKINNKSRIGISVGTTMGEIERLEKSLNNKNLFTSIGMNGPNVIADEIYDLLNLNGPNWTLTNACAAGNLAISRAMMDIKFGRADVMIVGGVDILSWVALVGFNSLRALSPNACKPFNKSRQGVALGEGAGVLILESKEHLENRLKKPKAVLSGFGLSCDAYHITQPNPKAIGAMQSMNNSLKMANLAANEIDYISAHGTGTIANDLMENVAIETLFKESKPPVSSIKGNIGHTLGAASAIEAVVSIKMLEMDTVPENKYLDVIDPAIKINVLRASESKRVEKVISNSFAFGGINTSLVIERW